MTSDTEEAPQLIFFLVLLLLVMPEGRREYVDTSKGKDKSWYRCWYAGWWCYLKAKIAAGALIADDAWGRAWVCGQERGGVDGWTGGRVEGGSWGWVDRVIKSLLRKFESKSTTASWSMRPFKTYWTITTPWNILLLDAQGYSLDAIVSPEHLFVDKIVDQPPPSTNTMPMRVKLDIFLFAIIQNLG